MLASSQERGTAESIVEQLAIVLDDDAGAFCEHLWRKLLEETADSA